MPIFKSKNEQFFSVWSSKMAYVTGFIAADGSLWKNRRGAHFIEIQSTDREIVYAIREALQSNLAIGEYKRKDKPWNMRYRLQIGSKKMYNDLADLGIHPRKTYRVRIPLVPSVYMKDFLRGYFDGDGGVCDYLSHKNDRKNPTRALVTTFTSCSLGILQDVAAVLHEMGKTRLKVPLKKWGDNAFELRYSTNDSKKIYHFLYSTNPTKLLLPRKKVIFERFMRA